MPGRIGAGGPFLVAPLLALATVAATPLCRGPIEAAPHRRILPVQTEHQNWILAQAPPAAPFVPGENAAPARRRIVANESADDFPNLVLTLPQPVAPLSNGAIETTRPLRRLVEAHAPANLILTLPATITPLCRGAIETTAPRRVRSNPIEQNWLLGRVSAPTLAYFQPADIQSPARHRKTNNETGDAPNLILTLPPAATPLCRGALTTTPRRRALPDSFQPPNQLLISSALAPDIGLTTADDYLVRRVRRLPQAENPPNLLVGTLGIAPPVVLPFPSGEWPIRPAKRFAQADGWPNVTLQTLSLPQTLVLPFASGEWPKRPPRRFGTLTEAPNLAISTLALAPPPPFAPVDLTQTARRWLRLVEAQGSALTGVLALPPPLVLPFPSWEWTVPRRPKVSGRDDVVYPGLGLYLPPPIIVYGGPRYIVKQPRARVFTVAQRALRKFTVSEPMNFRFDIKAPPELVPLTFDFSPDLLTGETLLGIPVVSFATSLGVDSIPSAIANGPAGLDVTATKVIVPVQAGLDLCEYDITVTIQTTTPTKKLTLVGTLPVRAKFI